MTPKIKKEQVAIPALKPNLFYLLDFKRLFKNDRILISSAKLSVPFIIIMISFFISLICFIVFPPTKY
nr:MAG TPA: hypothetical protein [Caudoviricetes sp.]